MSTLDTLMLLAAAAVVLPVLAQGMLRARRRARAWPDRLDLLREGYADWPWIESLALIGGGFVFGMATWGTGRAAQADAIAFVCVLSTGVALLHLVHRRWSLWHAHLGLLHLTLAVCTLFAWLFAAPGPETYESRLGAVLAGAAVMTFIWHWLARFWQQQLLDGQPWTTSGRMIPIARRIGRLTAVLALLLAAWLALRPLCLDALDPQDVDYRGATGIILLCLCLLGAARVNRAAAPLTGVLAVLSLIIGVSFLMVRM